MAARTCNFLALIDWFDRPDADLCRCCRTCFVSLHEPEGASNILFVDSSFLGTLFPRRLAPRAAPAPLPCPATRSPPSSASQVSAPNCCATSASYAAWFAHTRARRRKNLPNDLVAARDLVHVPVCIQCMRHTRRMAAMHVQRLGLIRDLGTRQRQRLQIQSPVASHAESQPGQPRTRSAPAAEHRGATPRNSRSE